MFNPIRLLWRRYSVVRSCAAEFGPPPAARYPELADYSDRELLERDLVDVLAEIAYARQVGRITEETTVALERVACEVAAARGGAR